MNKFIEFQIPARINSGTSGKFSENNPEWVTAESVKSFWKRILGGFSKAINVVMFKGRALSKEVHGEISGGLSRRISKISSGFVFKETS